jgi:hypothetical protein
MSEIAKPKAPAKSKATPIVKAKAKATKLAPKAGAKKPGAKASVAETKAKPPRAYTRKPKGAFADFLKKQAELEKAKKDAKAGLRKQYDDLLEESDKIKANYKKLFNESIESAPKLRGAGVKKTPSRGYTLEQVKLFIEQADNGEKVKIPGKNATGIARIKAAYAKAKSKDAESIFALLK